MLGTIVNTCTILIGGAVGATARQLIKDKYKKSLFDALGLACIVLGANAALPNMQKSEYPVLFILSLAIGSVIGTRLDFDGRLKRYEEQRRQRQSSTDKPKLIEGLTTAFLLYCIGTFAHSGMGIGRTREHFPLYKRHSRPRHVGRPGCHLWLGHATGRTDTLLLARYVLPDRLLFQCSHARAHALRTEHRRRCAHRQFRTLHSRHQGLQDH